MSLTFHIFNLIVDPDNPDYVSTDVAIVLSPSMIPISVNGGLTIVLTTSQCFCCYFIFQPAMHVYYVYRTIQNDYQIY
jgi:hypothetical protein